uniref:Uncharacterized protein n=1 Tax=Cacopsylla melanoneura TaxID=428564 RepID=A0A8D8QCZ0_9HEMI
MTSYKFVSLKDLDNPVSFQSKSVTSITQSEHSHKTTPSGTEGGEYSSKIEKSFNEYENKDGITSSKSDYSVETSRVPVKSSLKTQDTKDSIDKNSTKTNEDNKLKFSFLKDEFPYKLHPSHGDRSESKSSYEQIYKDFDQTFENLSKEKDSKYKFKDDIVYKKRQPSEFSSAKKEFTSSTESNNNYDSTGNHTNSRQYSFASTIPSPRIPPSHHDEHGSFDYGQPSFTTSSTKKSSNGRNSSSPNTKHSEYKTEYEKFEEHNEYLYKSKPSSIQHLIQDEIDFSSLMFQDLKQYPSQNIEDFSKYYFQVHHRNPKETHRTSRSTENKFGTHVETRRRTKPIVHYMVPESTIRKTTTQAKKVVNTNKTVAPRISHRDKYYVENYYDVDTKVVNSNPSSHLIYKERISSSDNRKCTCAPGVKTTKKPIVIYTYANEKEQKTNTKPVNRGTHFEPKRDIVLKAPKPSKSQSLENISIYSTEYLNRRFFDDYQLNNVKKCRDNFNTSKFNTISNISGRNRSCLVNKDNSKTFDLSAFDSDVKFRPGSRECLQKHVTFSDLVSMQSYSEHEDYLLE